MGYFTVVMEEHSVVATRNPMVAVVEHSKVAGVMATVKERSFAMRENFEIAASNY